MHIGMVKPRTDRIASSPRFEQDYELLSPSEVNQLYGKVVENLRSGNPYGVYDTICLFFNEERARTIAESNSVVQRQPPPPMLRTRPRNDSWSSRQGSSPIQRSRKRTKQ